MQIILRTLLFPFFFISISFITSAQEDVYEIINSSNHFPTIVEKAEDFFKVKFPNISNPDLCKGEHRDGSFVKYMRWKNFWKNRLNEDGTLGDPTKIHRTGTSRSSGPFDDLEWNNISLPNNLGGQIGIGRTTGIVFHPSDKNIFYVSTAIGGIWKTVDAGESYSPIGDNLPTLAVGCLLLDYSNTETIYAATGDRVGYGNHGIGLYKSTDDGNTWNATSLRWDFADQIRIYSLTIDPDEPTIIYAATDNGLYRSTDGFESHELIDSKKCYEVKFKPKNPDALYYTTENKLYRSMDNGQNFENIHEAQFGVARITVSNADPERIYYSKTNSLFQSFDGGNTFQDTIDMSELDNRNFGYAIISPTNPDVIYTGYFTTYKSEDNGASWNEITCFTGGVDIHVDNHFAAINPLEPEYVYFCNDGGLYKYFENPCNNCEDCYPAYEDLSSGMAISQYYDISISQQNPNIISGGTQDNASFFRNEFNQWERFTSSGDGMITAIDPQSDIYKYWEFQYGTIMRNTNGSNSCISCNIPNGESGEGDWVTPYDIDPNNTEVLVAGFTRMYRTKDRGETWKQLSSQFSGGEFIEHLKIAPSNSDVIYAIQGANIYRASTATNHTLLNWRTKPLPFEGVTSLEIAENDENKIFITRGGFVENSKVYISNDGGDTWENLSAGLPNVPANCIQNLNSEEYNNVFYVGTDAGVFYRDDELSDWVVYGDLPNTYVIDIEIQSKAKLIRIGTHGRSIYETTLPDNPCLLENPPDADGDGICDSFDVCPNGNDLLDLNENGIPDDCDPRCSGTGSPETENNWINYFSLGNFTNLSEKSSYTNFTHLKAQVLVGEQLDIQVGVNERLEQDRVYAWIDLNSDKIFSDSERLSLSAINNAGLSFGFLTIPEDTELGTYVLRIRNILSDNETADPCNEYIGEVEDYTIELVDEIFNNVPELNNNFGIKIRPNPGQNELHIHCKGYPESEIEVLIVNAKGEVVLEEFKMLLQDGTLEKINTTNLASGLYFVKVKDSKRHSVKKWLKE